MVNSCVVAFNIEASPLAICVCPQTIRVNGITLLRIPIKKKATQIFGLVGILRPVKYTSGRRARVASDTLRAMMVIGGRASTATPTKKKEPPYTIDNSIRSSYSYWLIVFTSGFMSSSGIYDLY